MSDSPLPLRTNRLTLRAFTTGDVDAVWAMRRQESVVRYLYDAPMTRDDAVAAVAKRIERARQPLAEVGVSAAIALTDGGEVVGDVSLSWFAREHRQAEIGFIVHPDHQGRGYAVEAAAEMLRVGFEHMDAHRIVGRCEARNTASARVLEKLGMRREAHLIENEWVKGEWQSELVYAVLRREFRPAGGL